MADTSKTEKKKQRGVQIISPKFVAKYAWLNKANEWGKYSVTGMFDPKVPENRALLAALKKEFDAAVASAQAQFKPTKKQPTLETTEPYEQDEVTGHYKINFGNKAEIKWKNPKTGEEETFSGKPAIFDAKGQPADVDPWAGSTLRVAIEVVPFFSGNKSAGVSIRLKQVQVIELVTRGAGGSVSAFDAVEGGFAVDSFGGDAGGADFSDDAPDEVGGDTPDEPDESQAAAPAADDFDF